MKSEYKTAKVYNLAKVIDYKAGDVIHADIFENDHGGATMLSLQQSMVIPQHLAPADVMIQVVEGKVEFTVDTDKLGLHTGDFMLLPYRTLHSVKALTDAKILLTKVRP